MILQGYRDQNPSQFWTQGSWEERPHIFDSAVPYEAVSALFDFDVRVLREPEMIDSHHNTILKKRQVFVNDSTNKVIGVHGLRRRPAHYKRDVLEFATELVGSDSGIQTAGLLGGGETAWIQVALTKVYGNTDLQFKPYLAIADSNSAWGGAWKASQGATLILCSNTLRSFFGMSPNTLKRVHRGQPITVEQAREQLELLDTHAQQFEYELDKLLNIEVSNKDAEEFATKFFGEDSPGKQTKFMRMYESHELTSKFNGTAFGLVQTVNTANHWGRRDKGQVGWEKNMEDTMFMPSSVIARDDIRAMKVLDEMGVV